MGAQPISASASILLGDVLAYIDWLRNEEMLSITLHRIEPYLHACLDSLLPFNIHDNALCMYAKQSLAVWKQCIACQTKVLSRAQKGPFFGMCWAGVSEFIVPIETLNGETVGFISISGYAASREKAVRRIHRVAEEYNLNADEMVNVLDQRMQWTLPDEKEIYTRVKPLARMLTMLIHILEEPLRKDITNLDQLYARVVQYLDHYYQLPITLDKLCSQFKCSPSYMSRLFNRYSELSIKQYLNNRRICTAKVFLENTSMSVQEIAYAVGFVDPNYFSTVFLRECGVPPREWRKSRDIQ